MTYIKLPYLHAFKDRHGRERLYFRKPGYPLVPLPTDVLSPEFKEAYDLANAASRMPVGVGKTKPGTISAITVIYYRSAHFAALEETTKVTYRRALERLRENYGSLPITRLESHHVAKMRDKFAASPTTANFMIRMLRELIKTAIEHGLRKDDPTLSVKKVKVKQGGFHTWTDLEIEQYKLRWPRGTTQRLAFDLLLHTAARGSDARRLTRSNIKGEFIEFLPTKTKNYCPTLLAIPIHPELAESLGTIPVEQHHLLVTSHGKPFTAHGFQNFVAEAARAAGLSKGVAAHGLRKAACRLLAEAGCSEKQIAAISGHQSLKEVQRYTKDANQKLLAQAAMIKRQEADVARHRPGFGKPVKE